jgi:hypothetical protein
MPAVLVMLRRPIFRRNSTWAQLRVVAAKCPPNDRSMEVSCILKYRSHPATVRTALRPASLGYSRRLSWASQFPKSSVQRRKARADREESERLAQFSSTHADELRQRLRLKPGTIARFWNGRQESQPTPQRNCEHCNEKKPRSARLGAGPRNTPNGYSKAVGIRASIHVRQRDNPMVDSGLQRAAVEEQEAAPSRP